jgi:hypothetical protein
MMRCARRFRRGIPSPYSGLLSFVSPKETNERKGDPIAAPFGYPARLARIGARLRAIHGAKARPLHPWRVPFGLNPIRAAMLGTADGVKVTNGSPYGIAQDGVRFAHAKNQM